MRSCDQSLVTVAFLWEKLPQPQLYKDLTRKATSFERWSWFKFNNLRLALGTNLNFYTGVAKGLKLKVRKFWGLISTFVEVRGEKLVRGYFAPPLPRNTPPTPSWIDLRWEPSREQNKFFQETGILLMLGTIWGLHLHYKRDSFAAVFTPVNFEKFLRTPFS